MTISHPKKFIFVHVHRTGGTTVTNLLKNLLGDRMEIISEHGNARTYEGKLLAEFQDYFRFGFTRNPWMRMLSWYSLIHRNDLKTLSEERRRLEEFIELDLASDFTTGEFHYNSIDYFSNGESEILVDSIFHFENFKTAISEITRELGLPDIQIPLINETQIKNYQEFYTDKCRDLIARKCAKDIEYFGYSF